MMTEHEKMLTGAPHQPYDAALAAMRQRCRDLLWRYNTQIPPHDTAARAALLTELPEGIYISAPIDIPPGKSSGHIGASAAAWRGERQCYNPARGQVFLPAPALFPSSSGI